MPETSGPVPVIFYSHGWGGKRATSPDRMVELLLEQNYAVLTWDARGFGDSGGEVNIDSQDFEVKDVRALIDLVATNDKVQLDAPGDPRMGMVGGSYAGGIQLMTASVDDRIDAIAPEIAWNDLPRSLKPGGVLKLGWGTLLYGAGAATATGEGMDSSAGAQTGSYDPMIHRGYAEATTLNDWTEETLRWFDERSPKHYLGGTKTPALIAQGASDTLFPLNEGIASMEQFAGPTKLIVFCGGHTMNPTGTSCKAADARGHIDRAIVRWFARYIKDQDVSTGPRVEYQIQDGKFRSVARLPEATISGEGSGRVVNTVGPTSGNGTAATPARDGMEVEIPVKAGTVLLGVGTARVEAALTGPEVSLFFKLIDVAADGTQTVIDDQAMAKKITRSGTHEVDLAGVAWVMEQGHSLKLEISPTSADHNSSRTPGVVDLEVDVEVPVITATATDSSSADDDTEVRGRRLRADDEAGLPVLPRTGVSQPVRTGMALIICALGLAMASYHRSRCPRSTSTSK